MILIPKPSSDQTGGYVTQDNMDQFWQRRLLVDQLVNAPQVDRTMKLLNNIKQRRVLRAANTFGYNNSYKTFNPAT